MERRLAAFLSKSQSAFLQLYGEALRFMYGNIESSKMFGK